VFSFNKIYESDIIILGLYPPPPGGIGVHLERLGYHLKREKIKFHVFNHGYFKDEYVTPTNRSYLWWLRFFFFAISNRKKINKSSKLFHFHIFSFLHYSYIFLFSRWVTDNIFITIHNENYFLYPRIKKIIFLILISKISCKKVISVSKKIYDLLLSRSVNSMFLNAYISVPYQPKKIIKDIQYTYMAMNMWRFNTEQIHRYGADLIFKLIDKYPQKYKLHIYVSDKNKSVDLKAVEDLFEVLVNIKDNISIFFGRSLVEYIGNYDIFLRPNRSDGFGVSILEALNSKIPVIASDTCIRPDGSITFNSGDYESFTKQLSNVIEGRTKLTFPQNDGNKKRIVELYKEYIN
jgi:glycosyltransferase involved in cell wall biosynthesis